MQSQAVDVPVWLGILMFFAGMALTIAMAKWVAMREKRRKAMEPNSKA